MVAQRKIRLQLSNVEIEESQAIIIQERLVVINDQPFFVGVFPTRFELISLEPESKILSIELREQSGQI